MLDNSQTPPYSATYTFSPTTVSLQHLFSTDHFFGKYSMFIPLTKNTETAWRMASELSTDTTKTSTSFDSSSATSKVNVKPITCLLFQITLNITHSLFSFFGLGFCFASYSLSFWFPLHVIILFFIWFLCILLSTEILKKCVTFVIRRFSLSPTILILI